MNLALAPALEAEIRARLDAIMASCRFIGGEWVERFEAAFAEYVGVKHCIAVGNGTDALEIAIEALGMKGAEIVVPALTAVPTAEAVVRSGNVPRYCDVDVYTLTMDPRSLERALTPQTSAVIPVHLYGQPCDMAAIVAAAPGCWIIEDCSHAHGAMYKGRRVGSIGDVGVYSFYPTKPLGAWGDAGAITTNSASAASRCRRIRNHGRLRRDDFALVGRNSRMDALQAAVLEVKLPYLDEWNAARRALADCYGALVRQRVPIQGSFPCTTHAYHQYVVRVAYRDAVRRDMAANGVETLVHYPYIVPNLPRYRCDGDWPIAEQVAREVVSLPMHLHLTDDDVSRIAEVLLDAV